MEILYHLYLGFNKKYSLSFMNENFVPLVLEVFKIVSSIWNNTSLHLFGDVRWLKSCTYGFITTATKKKERV